MPKVSVLMPVYNGERYVCEAIDSILGQTFEDFEFLIFNDGSTDRTSEIIHKYNDSRIRHFSRQTNKGYVHALNYGLEIAQGELIARQDADDISLPKRFEEQVGIFDAHANVVIVGSAWYAVDEDSGDVGYTCPPTDDTSIRWRMLFGNSFAHTAVMVRGETLQRNRLIYNPDFVPGEDFELWSRLLLYGCGVNIGRPLVKVRVHGQQVSQVASEKQSMMLERTARSNLEGVGIFVADDMIRTMREWYKSFPKKLSDTDLTMCRLFLRTLKAFGRQEKINRDVCRELRKLWTDRILKAVGLDQSRELWRSGLLQSLLRFNAGGVLSHVFRRAIRRAWGSGAQITKRFPRNELANDRYF